MWLFFNLIKALLFAIFQLCYRSTIHQLLRARWLTKSECITNYPLKFIKHLLKSSNVLLKNFTCIFCKFFTLETKNISKNILKSIPIDLNLIRYLFFILPHVQNMFVYNHFKPISTSDKIVSFFGLRNSWFSHNLEWKQKCWCNSVVFYAVFSHMSTSGWAQQSWQ